MSEDELVAPITAGTEVGYGHVQYTDKDAKQDVDKTVNLDCRLRKWRRRLVDAYVPRYRQIFRRIV